MNEHVSQWLDAYHDGELSPQRAQQVEVHLETCENCQLELDQLRSLSVLLLEYPLPEKLTQPDKFVAQVGLRLPRKTERSFWKQTLFKGWQWAPVSILGIWVFFQAAFIASAIFTWALPVLPLNEQIAAFLPVQTSIIGDVANLQGADLAEIGRFGLEFMGGGGPLGWGIILNLSLTILVGLFYLSWLTSWWVQQSNINPNSHLSSNGMKGVQHES